MPLTLTTDAIEVGAVPSSGRTTFAVTVDGSGQHALSFCPSTSADACEGDRLDLEVTAVTGARDPALVLGTQGEVRLANTWTATVVVDLPTGTYRVYCAVPFHDESGEQTLLAVGG